MPHGWNFEHTYADLPGVFHVEHLPVVAPAPQMVAFNNALAEFLGLDAVTLQADAEIFSGAKLPPGARPIAQAYAGYQFGHFSMLGDGRAALLGEQIVGGQSYDIQLKGAGPTPFSRGGDGLAALLPMLREYLVSEAMFYLGIPTTRSLAVALTGKAVHREKPLPGAVLTRVAGSHIRVGTFDYARHYCDMEQLRALADYTIKRHFPGIADAADKYLLLFREVCKKQAALIAGWQLAGFVHGVMNTDNMAVSGETIDFGPCAFLDDYDPNAVFSSIDVRGRYAFKNQPGIGAWNLARLAEALLPLLSESHSKAVALAQSEIGEYWRIYEQRRLEGMRAKLGIEGDRTQDAALVDRLLDLMAEHGLDYTSTFSRLAAGERVSGLEDWQRQWRDRKSENTIYLMGKSNPATIPRNHKVEEALEAAGRGDFTVFDRLLEALRNPYEFSETYSPPPTHKNCEYKTFCGT